MECKFPLELTEFAISQHNSWTQSTLDHRSANVAPLLLQKDKNYFAIALKHKV
jgi:hypothetical protein